MSSPTPAPAIPVEPKNYLNCETGFKSWLLKPFDPLLRRDGAGTRLVVKVEGTRDAPKLGLDMGATLKGKP